MFTRNALAQSWRDVRPYFIFAILLFFACVIVGGTPNGATGFLQDQLRAIEELAKQTQQSDNPQLAFFWVIFKKNLMACIVTMYLGVIAGIFPIFTMALNGMLLGFVFGGLADHGKNVWPVLLKGILPHGILEFPALFLSAGFGMLLGMTLLKGIFGSMFGKTSPWSPFLRAIYGTVPALILLAVLLLFAAIIESTVTYSLMS